MSNEPRPRKPYPSDVSDEEWAFVAPALGGGAQLCLDDAVSAVGQRLRTTAHHRGGPVFCGVCVSDAPSLTRPCRPKSLTGSRLEASCTRIMTSSRRHPLPVRRRANSLGGRRRDPAVSRPFCECLFKVTLENTDCTLSVARLKSLKQRQMAVLRGRQTVTARQSL